MGYNGLTVWSNGGSLHAATTLSEPGPPYNWGFTITLRHTTFSRTPLDELSSRRRYFYLTTHVTHNWQTSMPPTVFEAAFPAS